MGAGTATVSEYLADTEADDVIYVDLPTWVCWHQWHIIQRCYNPQAVEHGLAMLKWYLIYSPHEDQKTLARVMLRRHEKKMFQSLRNA